MHLQRRDSLGPYAIKHRALWLSDSYRVAAQRVPQRRTDRASPGKEAFRGRVRAVLVRDEERAVLVAEDVVERLRELRVVDGRVEPAQDRTDLRVRRPVRERERSQRVILWILELR